MTSVGNKGKFSDRLKKMRRDRLKRKKCVNYESNIISSIKNLFFGGVSASSSLFTSFDHKENKTDTVVDIHSINIANDKDTINAFRNSIEIKKINTLDIKKRHNYNYNRRNIIVNDTNAKLEVIEKDIINLIKKNLVKQINELEILQSDLYVLSEIDSNDIYYKKCKENIDKIKKILTHIQELKNKYDFLKDNFDFEYMLELNDPPLYERIIQMKNICEHSDLVDLTEDYKLLDEYKYLYLKIDKIQEDAIKYEEYKNNKIEELKERDIDFEKFKNNVYNYGHVNETYSDFIKRQNNILSDLDDKVSKIDSYEDVTFKIKGFDKLLSNTCKYMGLLFLTPLKGLIPGIATQTIITRDVVRNLYRNLHYEETSRTVYAASNYLDDIKIAMNNLDKTSNLVDETLDDVIKLRLEFKNKFKKYEINISEYHEVSSKLEKLENNILGNKIKMDIVKARMQEKALKNQKTLKLVKTLNKNG